MLRSTKWCPSCCLTQCCEEEVRCRPKRRQMSFTSSNMTVYPVEPVTNKRPIYTHTVCGVTLCETKLVAVCAFAGDHFKWVVVQV